LVERESDLEERIRKKRMVGVGSAAFFLKKAPLHKSFSFIDLIIFYL